MKLQLRLEKALGFLMILALSLGILYWLAFKYVWPVVERREGAAALALIVIIGLFVWWRIKVIVNGGKGE